MKIQDLESKICHDNIDSGKK